MPDPRKPVIVKEAVERFNSSSAVFFTDFSGLSAVKATELRADLRAGNVQYVVAKKTLVKVAAKEAGLDDISEIIDGMMGMAFTAGEPSDPAKILTNFAKANNDIPVITGILLDGQIVPAAKAKQLADMPSRDALLGQLLSTLSQPMTRLVGTISSPMVTLGRALMSLKDKKNS